MPKALRDFTLNDWAHLRPLTQAYKNARYDAADRRYVGSPARTGDIFSIGRTLRGRRILIAVAFEDPQAIDWQLQLLRRYVPHDVYLIADNSSDDAAAAAIRTVAERAGAPYLRLPLSRRRLSHNHGLALNWLWRNLLRPGAPAAFGFLDDDLFPTAPDDPFSPLTKQDFYGIERQAGERRYLWAGFCFFRFAAVAGKPLDFRPDYFGDLDTGGRNWEILYRHTDLAHLRWAPMRSEPFNDSFFQWSNAWLHEVGTNDRPALTAEKRAIVTARLAPHLGKR